MKNKAVTPPSWRIKGYCQGHIDPVVDELSNDQPVASRGGHLTFRNTDGHECMVSGTSVVIRRADHRPEKQEKEKYQVNLYIAQHDYPRWNCNTRPEFNPHTNSYTFQDVCGDEVNIYGGTVLVQEKSGPAYRQKSRSYQIRPVRIEKESRATGTRKTPPTRER